MTSRQLHWLVVQNLFTSFSIAAFAASAQSAVIFNVLVNPPTTAGGGALSTRSGPGSWQLYAVDDNADDFGISSYNITMTNTTAVNHRSPQSTITDSAGDPQTAGFTLFRTGANANPIQAAQSLPGQTPYLIKGFGQTAGNFCAVAGGACAQVIGPTESTSWGTYSTVSPFNGKNWLLIAEGLYNQSGPRPAVTAATVTVFNANFTSKLSAVVIPEPSGISLIGLAFVSVFGCTRRRS